ncbi:hypothetical protein [Cupriavidus basilensis]|uniref:hypothetical protein n=1 Tax=Cupriavidus basilensis TaxID=68895 RepID=UPI0023E89B47|nr:hypothetical protein [Cupriavidus basilensis]MDF3884782.1 hypothetical protein [Cupriavidus basilensis]
MKWEGVAGFQGCGKVSLARLGVRCKRLKAWLSAFRSQAGPTPLISPEWLREHFTNFPEKACKLSGKPLVFGPPQQETPLQTERQKMVAGINESNRAKSAKFPGFPGKKKFRKMLD